jgi:predicted CoA-binding protein/predicted transcriptional regulator
MSSHEAANASTPELIRQRQFQNYWAGDLSRRTYLMRRQRKTVLESCRRIAVVGASDDPNSASYIGVEKLLGLSLEIIPVFPDRVSFLGLRCYPSLRDVPGRVDIVQVYPDGDIAFADLARAAVDRGVSTFWIERGSAPTRDIVETLTNGHVQLVEYECLEEEYLKHVPMIAAGGLPPRKEKKRAKVRDRMSKSPATVMPLDGLNEAIWKMEHGRFRHLPVIDENGKLIGMLSDSDVRMIRPSLAFVDKNEANVQIWSISVQQAAVFDPVKVTPETPLKEAAELMLRWHVGGLPVVADKDKLVGIITYTDLLREFVGHE